MRTLQFALVALLVIGQGCRSNNSQVLVEQEARMLEDEVYRLEAQIDECCRQRKATMLENEELKRQLGQGRGGRGDYRAPAVELPGPGAAPRQESPLRREAPADLQPPTIELPEASDTPPVDLIPADQEPSAGRPTKLSINNRLTGGLDRDGAGGDEGIMVMVEPRDEQGRLVRTPGAVSIVVMDPARLGDEARVARWDFQAHEFDDHFQKSAFGRGLRYELQWPGEAPRNRELVLFVRYVADDGTKITSDAPLRVRMASDSPRSVRHGEDDRREPRSRLRSRDRADDPPRRQARGDRPEWRPYR